MLYFDFKRIKKPELKPDSKRPDYDGFFTTKKGNFYVLGWLENLSSDMKVRVEIVNDEFLKNTFNRKRYAKWLSEVK